MLRATIITITAVSLLSACDSRTKQMDFPSSSMTPTIPPGSVVTVDMNAYETRSPNRFDLVVFTPPGSPDSRFGLTVVGLPGETVEVEVSGLNINGAKVGHPNGIKYVPADDTRARVGGDRIRNSADLGEDEYFLLGDNSGNARDSRYLGPIGLEAIHGRITKIEQDGADQPATAPESKAEGKEKPKPESQVRPQ